MSATLKKQMCHTIILTQMVVLVVSHTRAKSSDLQETLMGKFYDGALYRHILKVSMLKNRRKGLFEVTPVKVLY